MKKNHLTSMYAVFLMAVVIFSSCKKEEVKVGPNAVEPITGSWVGKYGIGNASPSTLYSFYILPAGTLHIRDFSKAVVGKGTWKLAGGIFYGVYTYELGGVYHLTGKYNENNSTITGSWGKGESGTADGDFFLTEE